MVQTFARLHIPLNFFNYFNFINFKEIWQQYSI